MNQVGKFGFIISRIVSKPTLLRIKETTAEKINIINKTLYLCFIKGAF